MSSSGYSGKPLWQKLGLKAGSALIQYPPDEAVPRYWDDAPFAVERLSEPSGPVDFIHSFVLNRADLGRCVNLLPVLSKTGQWWISWPKKASGRMVDVTEDTLREVFLPLGIVDVKVCSVTDELWSGLKFMWRKELR